MKATIGPLAGVFLLLVVLASASLAQVPNIAIYSDEMLQNRDILSCPDAPPGSVIDTLYIVADGFNMAMASVEFMVDISEYFLFLADVVFAGVLKGTRWTGSGFRTPHPPMPRASSWSMGSYLLTCVRYVQTSNSTPRSRYSRIRSQARSRHIAGRIWWGSKLLD